VVSSRERDFDFHSRVKTGSGAHAVDNRSVFPSSKRIDVSSSQLTYFWCRSQQRMELFLCSPLRLIRVLHIYFGVGTFLPESYTWKECLKREHAVFVKIKSRLRFISYTHRDRRNKSKQKGAQCASRRSTAVGRAQQDACSSVLRCLSGIGELDSAARFCASIHIENTSIKTYTRT